MARILLVLVVIVVMGSSGAQAQKYLITGSKISASPSAFNSRGNDSLDYFPPSEGDVGVLMYNIGMPESERRNIANYDSNHWHERKGQSYRAWVQSRKHYTVCASVLRKFNPDPPYCERNLTFTGTIGTVGNPAKNNNDGLHLSYVVPMVGHGIDQKPCHLHARVLALFVEADISRPGFCRPPYSQSFHRGK